ncbi:hypothetical protein TNCV_3242861 [Trichonephila clavipes]|nr:hypothetical protein TNCV_3242861 [Trichonephila clavipes]
MTLSHSTNVELEANAQSFFQKHRDTPGIYVAWNSAPSQKYQVYLEHILLPQRSFLPSLPALQQVFHRQGLLKILIRKKSKGDRSGDRAGHAIGPPRPIQPPGKVVCRCALTSMLKCAGAPSC